MRSGLMTMGSASRSSDGLLYSGGMGSACSAAAGGGGDLTAFLSRRRKRKMSVSLLVVGVVGGGRLWRRSWSSCSGESGFSSTVMNLAVRGDTGLSAVDGVEATEADAERLAVACAGGVDGCVVGIVVGSNESEKERWRETTEEEVEVGVEVDGELELEVVASLTRESVGVVGVEADHRGAESLEASR